MGPFVVEMSPGKLVVHFSAPPRPLKNLPGFWPGCMQLALRAKDTIFLEAVEAKKGLSEVPFRPKLHGKLVISHACSFGRRKCSLSRNPFSKVRQTGLEVTDVSGTDLPKEMK